MATYKGIQGYTVQKLSSDPTVEDTVGQLWYNSTAGKFKISTAGAGAWSSGGALNVARRSGAYAGTQTTALIVSGIASPNSPDPAGMIDTETYDGTSWTEAPNCNTAVQYTVGVGSQTAAMKIAGSNISYNNVTAVETWNGSAWTSNPVSLTAARKMMSSAQAGSTTAALIFGGTASDPSTPSIALTELWNGSSWTELNDLNTARRQASGAGISTAALNIAGGPPDVTNVESWDGTCWAAVNPVNTARELGGAAGTQASAVYFAGAPTKTETETYDGTSWTEVANLATGRQSVGGAGTAASGLCISGYNGAPNNVAACEEWTDPVYTIKTVTVS